MTMIFEYLKRVFGFVDASAKKRKATEDRQFEEEYRLPKRFKPSCNTNRLMADYYFDVDDSDDDDDDEEDVIFLREQKCSLARPCVKLNGTHKKQQPQQPHQCHHPSSVASSAYKSTWSPFARRHAIDHNKSAVDPFVDRRHRMQDPGLKSSPTLCKINQLKEKNQYYEMLQTYLPESIHMVKHKSAENAYTPKPIETIDLDKHSEVVVASSNDKIRSTMRPVVVAAAAANAPANVYRCTTAYSGRGNLSSSTRLDKGRVPTLDYSKRDTAASSYLQPFKIQAFDELSIRSTARPPAPPARSPVKAVAINSLRDELAANAVMRRDFIPQVAKRYNERIEQRHREAEELKKMTSVLSKHNRYAREAALEEQLARSMKLCMTILDDREEPEEPDALPALTDEMLRQVRCALVPCPQDEVLAEGFGLRITRKDIHTLAGLNWLNDEVINFYMNLLIARGTAATSKYPRVHAMNTFFYPKLLSGGQSSLRRWTRKVDIFAQDLVVVPVHLDIHWCMSIIDFRERSIVYYDSMGGGNTKCLAALKQYLQDESLDKKKRSYDMSDWTFRSAKNIPQQMNGSDCGMFSCMFAEYVCANRKITFTQDDMPYFRNKMVYEILRGKLL